MCHVRQHIPCKFNHVEFSEFFIVCLVFASSLCLDNLCSLLNTSRALISHKRESHFAPTRKKGTECPHKKQTAKTTTKRQNCSSKERKKKRSKTIYTETTKKVQQFHNNFTEDMLCICACRLLVQFAVQPNGFGAAILYAEEL